MLKIMAAGENLWRFFQLQEVVRHNPCKSAAKFIIAYLLKN